MWIIFDLDDTLIDTSGSIVPQMLKNIFAAVEESGFHWEDRQKAFAVLEEINDKSLTLSSAVRDFGKHYRLPEGAMRAALHAMGSFSSWHLSFLVPNAASVVARDRKSVV